MAERPLLILSSPGAPLGRKKRPPPRPNFHVPEIGRQAERLGPRFDAIQDAFQAGRARLQADAAGMAPEQVIVLETVGSVQDFVTAVRKVQGMEWLGEIEEEDIPPDDDFFEHDKHGQRRDKAMRGRLFLVFSNQQALSELLSMWKHWQNGGRFERGLGKWQALFAQLRDVRPWGVKDRLLETGVLDDWQERSEHDEDVVPCEIELWFRKDHHIRNLSVQRITTLLEERGGQVIGQAVVDQIAYHALLARLPIAAIRSLMDEASQNTALVQCEQIQVFRASGQMAGILTEDARETEEDVAKPLEKDLLPPVVALFDGLPLQNHMRLGGYLVIDDPDGFEADYPARDRRHGTAMASLIVHDDLAAEVAPIHRSIYVRPILKPDPKDWNSRRQEIVPENMLVVDLMHRAVQRMLRGEGTEPPSASQVCVVNLSIGIRDRLFQYAMSPLARLLDWLAWGAQAAVRFKRREPPAPNQD